MTRQPKWIGLLLTGTLAWALVLGLVWYSAVLIPVLNLILTCLAVGMPAALVGWIASRRQLRRPVLLALTAYTGGAALAIAALQVVGRATARDSHHLIEACLVHFITGTLFVPAPDGGYQLFPVNLLWLTLAGITASITAEMAAKHASSPGRKGTKTARAAVPPPVSSEPASRPRPRRKRAARGGTGETNGDHSG